MQMLTRTALVAVIALLAAPAQAGSVYYWVTEEGTHAYSDSLKRVPNRYREVVRKSTLGTLANYERWTPSDRVASGDYASRLTKNLARLRAFNASFEPTPQRGGAEDLSLEIESAAGGLQFGLAGAMSQGPPVVVESARTELPGDHATRSVTFVRQGDQTLALIVGHDNDREIVELPGRDVEVLLQAR